LTPRDQLIVRRAVEIVEKARDKGIVLRILGAIAIYLHISNDPRAMSFYASTSRLGSINLFTDIDLVGYSKQKKEIMKLFEQDLKFRTNPRLNIVFAGKRLYYEDPETDAKVDVFFDKLEFSHDVVFGKEPGKGRLDLDYPTITPTDLLLEKLQIHRINYKDIVDVIALLIAHDVAREHRQDAIDGSYIAQILSDDWGFWYDATNNLNRVVEVTQELLAQEKISRELRDLVVERVNKLLKIIEEAPKTKNWLKRSKVGTSKPWYREVEEVY
jgi:hypothetical protein